MKASILVVLSALSFALSTPLPTTLQTRSLNQVVGPRDGTTLAQLWQTSATGNSNKARALSPSKQRRDNENGELPDSSNVDGNNQPVSDQSDNSVLLASGGPLLNPINTLSTQQTQFINTMLNKFGPDGPGTQREAQMVAEFAKGVAGRNALTVEETKSALNWLFKANWEYNPFINLIRAWTSTWKDD